MAEQHDRTSQTRATRSPGKENASASPEASGTSDANGLSASDEADGTRRRQQYEAGVELVSKPD